jgi:FkbM family methyltransferase
MIKRAMDQFLRKNQRIIVRYPLRQYLLDRHVDCVLDVGANVGQFGAHLRRVIGYQGRIESFEPLQAAFCALRTRSRHDPRWSAHHHGLGDVNQQMTLHIARNSVASSLRPLAAESGLAPDAVQYVGQESVRIARLDDVYDDVTRDAGAVFLKVDAQGYERQIIDGAPRSLQRLVGLQLELGLTPIYQGESMLEEILCRMRAMDFVPFWITPGYRNPDSQQLYQVDVCFFRN